MQLNHIHQINLLQLPDTDSRFRSDLRALEWGLYELSKNEKKRLEQKAEQRKTFYIPSWFENISGDWMFKGDYWTKKEGNLFENKDFF